MRIGINQFCFPASCDVGDALRRAKDLGYECMEICFTAAQGSVRSGGGVTDALDISGYFNRLLHEKASEADFLTLRRMAEDVGLPLCSVGGIMTFSIYPLTALDAATAQKSMDTAKRMLDAAQALGAPSILLIPGLLTEDMGYRQGFELAQSRVAELADYAPNVHLMIENVWNNMMYSPLELAAFVDGTGKSNVGVCFDVANARRFGYPQQWIRALGNRIMQIHCKDYRMTVDNINGFTNLLDGDVNYPAVIDALRELGYDGDLIVELTPPAHYLVDGTLRSARNILAALLKNHNS